MVNDTASIWVGGIVSSADQGKAEAQLILRLALLEWAVRAVHPKERLSVQKTGKAYYPRDEAPGWDSKMAGKEQDVLLMAVRL